MEARIQVSVKNTGIQNQESRIHGMGFRIQDCLRVCSFDMIRIRRSNEPINPCPEWIHQFILENDSKQSDEIRATKKHPIVQNTKFYHPAKFELKPIKTVKVIDLDYSSRCYADPACLMQFKMMNFTFSATAQNI